MVQVAATVCLWWAGIRSLTDSPGKIGHLETDLDGTLGTCLKGKPGQGNGLAQAWAAELQSSLPLNHSHGPEYTTGLLLYWYCFLLGNEQYPILSNSTTN